MKTVQLLAKPACACLMVFPFAASAQTLQEQIAANPSYPALEQAAYGLLKNGYNAGSHYPEIWIRDLNTFLLPSLEVNPAGELRKNLITTISLQASDGNIPDGYTPDPLVQHKNTVETDQETSLIQAIYKYVNRTGDRTILSENVSGLTVMARMEKALNFLRNFRYSAAHGLIWGGTTADWGDVQPEDIPGTQLNAASHKAVDIYDNAMLVIALGNFLSLANGNATIDAEWRPFLTQIKQNTRTVLWDSANQKFRPHVYLDGSPFPAGFDENAIYYHGGTTVAIEAGILTAQEAAAAFQKMAQNKAAAGANSIGLTLYPTYPQDYFQNGILSTPYTYQNGGDWTWFGARTISQMAQRNALPTAYVELQPMVDRVLNYGADFSEWNALDGSPQGSGTYRGTAGVLLEAIRSIRHEADPGAARIISPIVVTAASPTLTDVAVCPTSVTASSSYDAYTTALNTRNSTGLANPSSVETNAPYPTGFSEHSREQSNHWHSAVGVLTPTITWDLGGLCSVTGFHLWNMNQNPNGSNNLSNRGIRSVTVHASADNLTFTEVGTFSNLTKAPGENYYKGEEYALSIPDVRYVRFVVTQNWGSTQVAGLSEIRFRATSAPVGTETTNLATVRAEPLRNSAGLAKYFVTGAPVPAAYPGHSQADTTMWLTGAGSGEKSVVFHLGRAFDLTGFHLWNYNAASNNAHLTRGVVTADVAVSYDGVNFAPSTPKTFSLASGTSGDTGTHYPLSARRVLAVRFSNLANPASPDGSVGLSEIRFIGTTPLNAINITAAPVTGGVQLQWEPAAGATVTYTVQRAASSGGSWANLATGLTSTSYVDASTGFGAGYIYRVFPSTDGIIGIPSQADPVTAWTRFQTWKFQHLGSASAASNADPDHDTLNNLLEYALNADPNHSDPQAAPRMKILEGARSFNFYRIADPNLLYEIEESIDLRSWSIVWTSTGLPASNEFVSLGVDPGTTQIFLRLKISE